MSAISGLKDAERTIELNSYVWPQRQQLILYVDVYDLALLRLLVSWRQGSEVDCRLQH